MSDFRCRKCKQLQFKHRIRGNKVEIEVKCYACNTFSYLTIWIPSSLKDNIKQKKHEKNNKHK